MTRRVRDLTLELLDGLPDPCRSCVFWEIVDAPRGPRWGQEASARAAKEAWWQAAQLEWGICGKAVEVDDQLVGYATFGPAPHFPRTRRMGAAVSEDALLLATMWVDPAHRKRGVARQLLQSVLRETYRRGSRALEAYGCRDDDPGPCIIPEQFLLANGFAVLHEHATFPLLRLDLRQTARWQESVGHVLEGVISALSRRERAPAPGAPAWDVARR